MTDTTRPDGVERAGRYRKKPVVIDAWAIDFNNTPYPEWVKAAFAKDETETGAIDWCPSGEGLYINTLEGHMQASIGDYLIRGVAGELYACRADIFAATYEPAHVAALTAQHPSQSAGDFTPPHCDPDREDVFAEPTSQSAGEPVAYLDVGTGGYLDLGSGLTDEQLSALPKGRHMLGIIGTYGADGYAPSPPPTDAARVEADRSMLREARDAIQALRMANERWGLTQARRDAVNKAIAAVGRIDAALAAERREQA